MVATTRGIAALVCASAGLFCAAAADAQEPVANPAHTHMGHVADAFRDTPERRGLLATAAGEAAVVASHAGLMANATDLATMKRHAGHVLHAIDPTVETEGPGLGYGLRKAAEAVAAHITMAGAAGVATQNVRTHSGHVATAARNTVSRADEIVELARQVRAAITAEEAADLVTELDALARQLMRGTDANGDGRVGWQEREGGLDLADTHMGLMKRGEGLGS